MAWVRPILCTASSLTTPSSPRRWELSLSCGSCGSATTAAHTLEVSSRQINILRAAIFVYLDPFPRREVGICGPVVFSSPVVPTGRTKEGRQCVAVHRSHWKGSNLRGRFIWQNATCVGRGCVQELEKQDGMCNSGCPLHRDLSTTHYCSFHNKPSSGTTRASSSCKVKGDWLQTHCEPTSTDCSRMEGLGGGRTLFERKFSSEGEDQPGPLHIHSSSRNKFRLLVCSQTRGMHLL